MKKWLIAGGVSFALFVIVVNVVNRGDLHADVVATPAVTGPSASELASRVSAAIDMAPKWESIDGEGNGRTYRLGINYRDMPSGHREIEADTRRVLQAALDELVASGRSPSSEGIFVSTWARRHESGATGKPVVRLFGSATYDAMNDSISYKPMK